MGSVTVANAPAGLRLTAAARPMPRRNAAPRADCPTTLRLLERVWGRRGRTAAPHALNLWGDSAHGGRPYNPLRIGGTIQENPTMRRWCCSAAKTKQKVAAGAAGALVFPPLSKGRWRTRQVARISRASILLVYIPMVIFLSSDSVPASGST